MKMIYISQGNIPSKYAHTFQAMKMAEGFARQVDTLTLLTARGLMDRQGSVIDIAAWYGLNTHFRIVRLPVYRRHLAKAIVRGSTYERFDWTAAFYARLKSPELVFTRSPLAGYLCARLNLNTIIETHMEPDVPKFAYTILACRKRSFSGVVTISEELKQIYQQAGIPGNKIFVWPTAVNIMAFENLPDMTSLRQDLGLPQDVFIATYCGHLYQDRGIEEILHSAAKLPHVIFLLVGGWKEDVARYKAATRHLHNIRFMGFVPNQDIPKYLVASNVLVMPYSMKCSTVSWMSPAKLFEYMASYRPIIAADLAALRKHLKNEQNALLVRPDDPDELARAIERIRLNPNLATQLAHAAYNDVQPYTWDNRAKAILTHFSHE